jgi:hypothetical protein
MMPPIPRTPLLAGAALVLSACASSPTPATGPAPARPAATSQDSARPAGPAQGAAPRPYRQVVTSSAVTQDGLFKVHRIGERLLFEIPASALHQEMLLISRPVESTLQNPAGFFGGGTRQIVQWERMGNRMVLRTRQFLLTADSSDAIWRQVRGFRQGPVIGNFNVAAYGADSAAVIDVSDLFLSNIPELSPVDGIVRNRSWVDRTWAFPGNINIEVTQTGASRPPAAGGFGGGGAGAQPRSARRPRA